MTTGSPYGDLLPTFPPLNYGDVNEWRVERAVQRLVDRADAIFMSGQCSQEQYDAWHKALDSWAESQYAKTRFGKA